MDWFFCSYCRKTFPSKQECLAHKKQEHRQQIFNKQAKVVSKCGNKPAENCPTANLKFEPQVVVGCGPQPTKSESESESNSNDGWISNPSDKNDTRQAQKSKKKQFVRRQDNDDNDDKYCAVNSENAQVSALNSDVSNFLGKVEPRQNLKHVEPKTETKTDDFDVDFVKSEEISGQVENNCAVVQDFTGVKWSSKTGLKSKAVHDEKPLEKLGDVTQSNSASVCRAPTLNVPQEESENPRTDPAVREAQKIQRQGLNDSRENKQKKKKRTRNEIQIYQHITVLDGPPRLFKCEVCLKIFKTKANIRYHEFCQSGEKPFKCNTCGQKFISKSHFEYHERTHTGEKPFKCPFENCGKGFYQQGKLNRHLRMHTGERPFKCEQCSKGFANSQALRSHKLTHTGERPFLCHFCGKRCTNLTNVKKHMSSHTGERPFSCPLCSKSYGLKWSLDVHLRGHSSSKPFVCDMGDCTRAFAKHQDLKRHQLVHLELWPLKCSFCGAAFRRKDNLDRHVKLRHLRRLALGVQKATD